MITYIDPGTGSYVLQIIIACVVGAAYAVKLFWQRIIAFFGGFLTRRKKNPCH